ncbi:hypothetical protein BGW42_006935 [Actinomortierella wolfii]|nr:hypothetical protein BGW42_006935 [Actinomortierella wolfii]
MASTKDASTTSPSTMTSYANSISKLSPEHTILKTISRMCREKAPWRLIAQETGLAVEECQRLFYTKLDWRVPYYWSINGQRNHPDKEQIARLIHLVEEEGYSFDEIADRRLLSKRVDERRYIRYYHPAVLEQKYREILQQRKLRRRMMDQEHLPHHELLIRSWLLRSFELFGHDWERIAERTNAEMAEWYDRKRSRLANRLERERARSGDNPTKHQKKIIKRVEKDLARFEKDFAEQVPAPLTAEKAQILCQKIRRQDQPWTADDDAVLVYTILEKMQRYHWLTPAQVPLTYKKDTADDCWVQVANAVGNHTPEQCLKRWQAMVTLDYNSKLASTAQWHRFEGCQFWMAWRFFVSQPQILKEIQENFGGQITALLESAEPMKSSPATTRLSTRTATDSKLTVYVDSIKCTDRTAEIESRDIGEHLQSDGHDRLLTEVARVFSLSHLVAAFQRNRGADQCQKYFEGALKKLLIRSTIGSKNEKRQMPNAEAVLNKAIQEQDALGVIHFIRTAVVDPLLAKTLQHVTDVEKDLAITEEDSSKLVTVPKEHRLRSLWSPSLRNRLLWLVIAAKEGVKIPDEDVDWDEIASQLLKDAQKRDPGQRLPNISPQHCFSTWRYITCEHDLFEAEEMKAEVDDQEQSSEQPRNECLSGASGRHPQQQVWLDHEIVSLKLGVRRFGTSWADIRAQFLPRRQISEIHQKWFEISDKEEDKGASKTDEKSTLGRAHDEDYQALMHALKISIKPANPEPQPTPTPLS